MTEKISKMLLAVILTLAVVLGAYIAWQRSSIESQSKTVELAMDYNDLKVLSAVSNISFDKLLTEIKKLGVTSIGLQEETLSDASSIGEIYFAAGSGIARYSALNPYLKGLLERGLIKPSNSYIISENRIIRQRISSELKDSVGANNIKTIGPSVIEVSKNGTFLKDLGVGMSEAQMNYLKKKGFGIIPRVWNDDRYDIKEKIKRLKGTEAVVIFEGEEILGYPNNLGLLAKTLKANKINYGCLEIIDQRGHKNLQFLMNRNIVRVHSISPDELKKVKYDEAISRLALAVKERSIRLLYVRLYMPPQIADDPVKFNLSYLAELKKAIESEKLLIGKASTPKDMDPTGWEILLLGAGVVIGFFLLLSFFVQVRPLLIWTVLIISILAMVFIGANKPNYMLEKILALASAIIFPSYAIISQFSKKPASSGNIFKDALYMFINILADTALGIILIIALLANTTFMLGAQAFLGIKIALVLPISIVALYFFFKSEDGFNLEGFKEKSLAILRSTIPVWILLLLFIALVFFGILLARSGNFILPVSGFEKAFRMVLEQTLSVRPRTKEFLIGYPFLILGIMLFLKNRTQALPVILAIGAIGPVSMLNSFCHTHTPIIISLIRSFNGAILGVIIGFILWKAVVKSLKL